MEKQKIYSVIVCGATRFLCALAMAASSWMPPAEAGSSKGYVIESRDLLSGSGIFTKTDRHVKYQSIDRHFCYVASAPSWDMHVYNTDNKVYYSGTQTQFQKSFTQQSALNSMLLSTYDLIWQKTGKDKLFGHNVIVWTATPEKSQVMSQMHTHTERAGQFNSIELWAAQDIVLPKPVDGFMNLINRWPMGKGVPIRSIKYKLKGDTDTMLDTKSFKYVDVPDSAFDIPPGYHSTTNTADIMITRNGIIEDMLDSVGK